MKYLIIIEKGDNNYSAFSPDIHGCVTVGDTIENTFTNMKEAIDLYFEDTIENSNDIPKPKGLEYHIREGIFNEGQIAEDYFITQVEIQLPTLA
ncbi:MAG: type II toxin-antitoxin system HicB family antitoxin [Chitinophagaceae bacterium]|nr:type II toxin-antitoxin system HicB family antitoxin [Chitinophagaceae bacterium]